MLGIWPVHTIPQKVTTYVAGTEDALVCSTSIVFVKDDSSKSTTVANWVCQSTAGNVYVMDLLYVGCRCTARVARGGIEILVLMAVLMEIHTDTASDILCRRVFAMNREKMRIKND